MNTYRLVGSSVEVIILLQISLYDYGYAESLRI